MRSILFLLFLSALALVHCQTPPEPAAAGSPAGIVTATGADPKPWAAATVTTPPAPDGDAAAPAMAESPRVTMRETITPTLYLPTLTATAGEEEGEMRLLLFTRTEGFRHASIEDGIQVIQMLAAEHDFVVDQTEDPTFFNDATLATYDAVIFLSTTGDVLDESQEDAFERYIQAGGGFVGVHAATDTEYDWPWYGGLVGTYFSDHPQIQPAAVDVVDGTHPSTEHLPARWERVDEWYNFQDDPSGRVNVLLNLDESSYEGGNMGKSHPLAWYQLYDGGRSWYTAMGHTSESFYEPMFVDHLLGGILWAAGRSP